MVIVLGVERWWWMDRAVVRPAMPPPIMAIVKGGEGVVILVVRWMW